MCFLLNERFFARICHLQFKMNLAGATALVIILSNFYLGYGRIIKQSDPMDVFPSIVSEEYEKWRKSETSVGDRELLERRRNLHLNESANIAHEKHNRFRRELASKSVRSHTRRHNRKLEGEIQDLHDELSQVVSNLEKMTKKENELEKEVDAILNPPDDDDEEEEDEDDIPYPKQEESQNGNNENRLEINIPRTENDETQSKVEKRVFGRSPEGIMYELELLRQDRGHDLKEEDIAIERKLHEEIKRLRKRIQELLSRNRELRRNKKELCEQLYQSIKDYFNRARDNLELNKNVDSNSGEVIGIVEEKLIRACKRFFRGKEMDLHNLLSSDNSKNVDGTEDSSHREQSGSGERERIVRKNKKGRHLPKKLGENVDNRGTHNAGKQNSQKTGSERDLGQGTEVKLNDYMLDSQLHGKPTDYEEEANLTISTTEEDKQKVYDHIASVDDVTFCSKPLPVVIYPSDYYPVPNKYYTPQGTILHRCGNHSGCCPSELLTCVPAKKEKIVLHFFAAVLDGASTVVPHVEKLEFTNHTKCGCVFRHHAHYYL